MRSRFLCTTGLGALAIVLSTMSMGTASASGASAVPIAAGSAAAVAEVGPEAKGKCGTRFGAAVQDYAVPSVKLPDREPAGAADFVCPRGKAKRTFSTVTVTGFGGDADFTPFEVEVLANCGGEPCDAGPPLCSSTGIGSPTGSPIGVGPDRVVIKLDTKCTAKRGVNWLEVQAVTHRAWYWQTTSDVGARFAADWVEGVMFGMTGCMKYENDRNLESCLPSGDEDGKSDFMFKLTE